MNSNCAILLVFFSAYWFTLGRSQENSEFESLEAEEKAAAEVVQYLVESYPKVRAIQMEGFWALETNLNDPESIQANVDGQAAFTELWELQANLTMNLYNWREYQDQDLGRAVHQFRTMGTDISVENRHNHKKYSNFMGGKRNNDLRFCPFGVSVKDIKNCTLSINDVNYAMLEITNLEELFYYWKTVTDRSGEERVKLKYPKLVEFDQLAADILGFPNGAVVAMDSEVFNVETDELADELFQMWTSDFQPIYEELHAYMKYFISANYEGVEFVNGAIPLHVLGLWGNDFAPFFKLLNPYSPKMTDEEFAENLKANGISDGESMFVKGEEFVESMGLGKLLPSFFKYSRFEKESEDMACGIYFDFGYDDKIAILACPEYTLDYFTNAHRTAMRAKNNELYFNLPENFRFGPNVPLDIAIRHTFNYAALAPEYLQQLGLIPEDEDGEEFILQYLFKDFLSSMSTMAFTVALEKWRFGVYRNEIVYENLNCMWHRIQLETQGVVPPERRTEENLDISTHISVPDDYSLISDYVEIICVFQLFEAMCDKAGQFNSCEPDYENQPLHKCNLYGNTDAGELLKVMSSDGMQVDWREALKKFTGSESMNPKSFYNYYYPIIKKIKDLNAEQGSDEMIGWTVPEAGCDEGEQICTPWI